MKKIALSVFAALVTITLVMSIFTVSVAAEEFPRMKRGDLLTEIPTATVDKNVELTDLTKVENGEFVIAWDALEGASKYSVRVLFNINYFEKNKAALNFIYDEEFTTSETSVKVTGLQYNRRYTVLVYALDSEGKDIAVYDRVHVFTYPVALWEGENDGGKDDSPSPSTGITSNQIIIIIFSITAVVVVAAIITVIVILKKPAKKRE